jgi:hypothetical protein
VLVAALSQFSELGADPEVLEIGYNADLTEDHMGPL